MRVHIVANVTHKGQLVAPSNYSIHPASSGIGRTLFDTLRFSVRNQQMLSLFTNSNRLNVRTLDHNTGDTIFISGDHGSLDLVGGGLRVASLRSGTGIVVDSFTTFTTVYHSAFSVIFLSPPCGTNILYSTVGTMVPLVDSFNVVVYRCPPRISVPRDVTSFGVSHACHCNGVGISICEGKRWVLGGDVTVYPKDFSPIACNRLSVVSHTTGVFSGIVIIMTGGSSGGDYFSPRRHIMVVGGYAASVSGLRIIRFSKLLTRCTTAHNTATVVGKLHTVSSFRCRFRVTLTGGGLGPGIRALFLAATSRGVCLDSSVIGRVTSVNNSVSDFIPRMVGGSVVSEVGLGGWCLGEFVRRRGVALSRLLRRFSRIVSDNVGVPNGGTVISVRGLETVISSVHLGVPSRVGRTGNVITSHTRVVAATGHRTSTVVHGTRRGTGTVITRRRVIGLSRRGTTRVVTGSRNGDHRVHGTTRSFISSVVHHTSRNLATGLNRIHGAHTTLGRRVPAIGRWLFFNFWALVVWVL